MTSNGLSIVFCFLLTQFHQTAPLIQTNTNPLVSLIPVVRPYPLVNTTPLVCPIPLVCQFPLVSIIPLVCPIPLVCYRPLVSTIPLVNTTALVCPIPLECPIYLINTMPTGCLILIFCSHWLKASHNGFFKTVIVKLTFIPSQMHLTKCSCLTHGDGDHCGLAIARWTQEQKFAGSILLWGKFHKKFASLAQAVPSPIQPSYCKNAVFSD